MGHPVNLLGDLFRPTLIFRRQRATKQCEDTANPVDTKEGNNDTKEKEEMEAIVVGP